MVDVTKVHDGLPGNDPVEGKGQAGQSAELIIVLREAFENGYRQGIVEAVGSVTGSRVEDPHARVFLSYASSKVATAAEAQSSGSRFKAAFGSLKGKNVFGDDAVAFEREMRDEWQ